MNPGQVRTEDGFGTTTDCMYIPGIDQSQQISAKTGEIADKSDHSLSDNSYRSVRLLIKNGN